MVTKYILPTLAAVLLVSGLAWGAVNSVIRESVALCNPNSPSHCSAPDASGNVPVTIGTAGTVTANQGTPAVVGNAWPVTLAIGGALNSLTNPIFTQITASSTTIAGSAPGTAGTASANVVTIQGIAAMTKLLVTPDANSAVNVAQINGATPLMGAGNTGTGSPRVTIATDQANLTTPLNVAAAASASGGGTFTHLAAGQATTVIKSGAGTLYALTLNSAASATNITTLYDNTSAAGTVIAIPAAVTATIPISIGFGPNGLAFTTGLTVKTETANGSDMTFVWK